MTISVRFSDEDTELIKAYAEMNGMMKMKKYSVEYTQRAVKNLRKLDKHTRNLIIAWIEKNLVDCENPRIH